MVRASASGAVDSGLVPSRVKPMTVKLVFTAFLLNAPHQRDCVENNPISLLVVPLEIALNRITPSWCGIDRWPATPKQTLYNTLIAISW